MMGEKMVNALNAQIVREYFSAYLYLAMAAWFEKQGLKGFSNWMRVQAQEELCHGTIMFNFLAERGGRIRLGAIDAPPVEWESPLAIFEAAYAHEQVVTGFINDLVDLAIAESDHAANAFLQWFVKEQVEEEASTSAVAQELALVKGDGRGLLMLDRELAARTFVMPAPLAGPAA